MTESEFAALRQGDLLKIVFGKHESYWVVLEPHSHHLPLLCIYDTYDRWIGQYWNVVDPMQIEQYAKVTDDL